MSRRGTSADYGQWDQTDWSTFRTTFDLKIISVGEIKIFSNVKLTFVTTAQSEINWLLDEMKTIEAVTCIRFEKLVNNVKDYIEIVNDSGCWSYVGRIGGAQKLSMKRDGCFHKSFMVHEVIHALGFMHMVNNVDRDKFVRIHWENVAPENYHWFDKVDPRFYSNLGTGYDLLSVMHNSKWSNTKNGKDTIIPHNKKFLPLIGEMGKISEGDALRINRMYQCSPRAW